MRKPLMPVPLPGVHAGVDFADLALELEPVTHRLLFLPGPLAEFCRCNGLDTVAVLADDDLSCSAIGGWYVLHIAAGGEPDPVMVELLAEVADNPPAGAAFEQ